MFGERRRHVRTPINRIARIQKDSGEISECTITDISDSGARLFVDDHNLPPSFDLLIYGAAVNRQECRIAWQNGGEIGVEFIGSHQTRGEIIDRLREEARRIFAGEAAETPLESDKAS